MPRPPNTFERRAQIVAGLLAVMSERGYAGASIRDIGRTAGLTPGLVHYHFETKLDILKALIVTLSDALKSRYRQRSEGAVDAETRLFAYIDAHVALGRDADPRAVAAWNVIGAEAVRHPEVRVLYREVLGASLTDMRKLVRDMLEERGRSTKAAARIAAGLLSAIEGAYRIAAAGPKGMPSGYAAPVLRSMARALVEAEPHR